MVWNHLEILDRLRSRGLPCRLVSTAIVCELGEEIRKGCLNGAIDKALRDEYLPQWSFEPPAWSQSILVLATPKPLSILTFHRRGQRLEVAVPPTYVSYRGTTREVEALLNELLHSAGGRAETAQLPLKLLAARSGLVRYGRNNITYLPGLGSFFQLDACYTDLRVAADGFGPPQMLDACEDCRVCARLCPTGIIGGDAFQIHAGRCLTFFNEGAAEIPDWISKTSHHSLIGCMFCQQRCPENRSALRNTVPAGAFDEEETEAILMGAPAAELPPHARETLSGLALTADYPLLVRNLRLVFEAG